MKNIMNLSFNPKVIIKTIIELHFLVNFKFFIIHLIHGSIIIEMIKAIKNGI